MSARVNHRNVTPRRPAVASGPLPRLLHHRHNPRPADHRAAPASAPGPQEKHHRASRHDAEPSHLDAYPLRNNPKNAAQHADCVRKPTQRSTPKSSPLLHPGEDSQDDRVHLDTGQEHEEPDPSANSATSDSSNKHGPPRVDQSGAPCDTYLLPIRTQTAPRFCGCHEDFIGVPPYGKCNQLVGLTPARTHRTDERHSVWSTRPSSPGPHPEERTVSGSCGLWGPDQRQAAVCVTFDHLGEAAELQAGLLPLDEPRGKHPSVSRDLPRVLALLQDRDITTTFYVEALNCELYPDALRSIVSAGHTLGWHGWWNEPMYTVSTKDAEATMKRTLAAFDALGLRVSGARPPGGLLGGHPLGLYRDAGFEHLSFAGSRYGLVDGVAMLPFAWPNVDGCYYFEQFAPLRVPPGRDPVGPRGLLEAHLAHVDQTVARGACTSFVFHVPWTDRPERVAVIGELIDNLARDRQVWLASPDEVAGWMSGHPDDFPAITHQDEPPAW
ncbi:polysaccharide deacetylase family protein [Rhodococcus sp. NPDC127530]|uniref:polysaccharide deacetylase family protein n=1 Tax=unclassified Rhodococcus (in: high G+C Gram-positive bacteria) TaxID=192944 RepID=UPI003636AF2B